MDQATRDNKNKLDYTILPWEVVGEVVKVFTFGASKYTRDNYQKGDGLPLANYHQSAMRHMAASMQGEELDPESQLDHMAHVATNALMYLWQKQHEAKKMTEEIEKCLDSPRYFYNKYFKVYDKNGKEVEKREISEEEWNTTMSWLTLAATKLP